MIFTSALASQKQPSCPYKPLSIQIQISGKKNVRLFGVMTKTSVSSDKNVPLADCHASYLFVFYLAIFSKVSNQLKQNVFRVGMPFSEQPRQCICAQNSTQVWYKPDGGEQICAVGKVIYWCQFGCGILKMVGPKN